VRVLNDSSNAQGEAKKTLLKTINTALKEYFDVRRQRAELKLKYEKKQAAVTTKYQAKDEPLAVLEAELAIKLRALIVPNELLLLGGKLRSFATTFGKVSFKRKAETTKIVDAAGFEQQARKDRNLTTLGSFVRTWKPLPIKDIKSWMKANPKAARRYAPFMETGGDYDELYVKPNEPYLTEHDPNQLTASSVNLGKVEVSQDESPDA